MDEYVRAEGGAKALARIQTASITGSVTDDATGKSGTYSLITKAPNKFYSEMIVEPHRVIEAYNGKSAWGQDTSADSSSTAGTAPHTLTGAAASEWEATGRYLNEQAGGLEEIQIRTCSWSVPKMSAGARRTTFAIALAPHVTREVFFDVANSFA